MANDPNITDSTPDVQAAIDRAIAEAPEKYKPQFHTRGTLGGEYTFTTTYDTPFGVKTLVETNGGAAEVHYQPSRNPLELGWKQEYSREQFADFWRIDAKDMTPRERQHVIDHLASQGVVAKEFNPLFGGKDVYIDVPTGNAALKGAAAKDFGHMVMAFQANTNTHGASRQNASLLGSATTAAHVNVGTTPVNTTHVDQAFDAMGAHLAVFNPNSLYSEAQIMRYVQDCYVELGDHDPAERQRRIANKARLISHLPPEAQAVLIEQGNPLRAHEDIEKLNQNARTNGTLNTEGDVSGFYRGDDRSVNWASGESGDHTILHEIGHGVDDGPNGYTANHPSVGLAAAVKKHLARSTNLTPANHVEMYYGQFSGRKLHEHLSYYVEAEHAKEMVAELFAERTVLTWQYPNDPAQVERVLLAKYPEIWPEMRDNYLPRIHEKVAEIKVQRNEAVKHVVEKKIKQEGWSADDPRVAHLHEVLSGSNITLRDAEELNRALKEDQYKATRKNWRPFDDDVELRTAPSAAPKRQSRKFGLSDDGPVSKFDACLESITAQIEHTQKTYPHVAHVADVASAHTNPVAKEARFTVTAAQAALLKEHSAYSSATKPGAGHVVVPHTAGTEHANGDRQAFYQAVFEGHDEKPKITKGRLESHAARVATVATMTVNGVAAVNAAMHGDMDAAKQYAGVTLTNAAMEVAQSDRVWKAVANATGKLVSEKAGTIVKAVGGKIPVVGAVVGAVVGLWEIGSETVKAINGESNWEKVASTTLSAVANTAGGFVGFGAGELLQEGVHYGTKAAFGEKNAAAHSATVTLAITAYEVEQAIAHGTPEQPSKNWQPILSDLEKKGWGKYVGNGDAHVTLDEVKKTLAVKGVAFNSLDKNGDGISGKEISDALQPAHKTGDDKKWQPILSDLEKKGWGKYVGNGDAHVTLDEVKKTLAAHGVKFDNKTLDKNGDGISAHDITDALNANVVAHHGAKKPTPTGRA